MNWDSCASRKSSQDVEAQTQMVYEDLAPQFYDAFCFVNHCNPQHPCRNWHVDKAIKRN